MALTIGGLVLLGNAIRDALEDGEKIKPRKKRTLDEWHDGGHRHGAPARKPWPPWKPGPNTTW